MSRSLQVVLYVASVLGIWSLWLGEITWFKGWDGVSWTRGFNWSSFPICAGISLLASWVVPHPNSRPRRAPFVCINTGLAMGAFIVARDALYGMVTAWWPTAAYSQMLIARALLAGLAIAVGTPLLANWFLTPLQRWSAAALGLGLLLVLPLSAATIALVPGAGREDWEGLKIGYPILWAAALVPLSLRLARRSA